MDWNDRRNDEEAWNMLTGYASCPGDYTEDDVRACEAVLRPQARQAAEGEWELYFANKCDSRPDEPFPAADWETEQDAKVEAACRYLRRMREEA